MWILAIDIGGTAIKCGLVNSQGERRQLTQFPMNKEYATVTQRICRHIDAFYAATFDGIAISSTGLVDPRSQEIGMTSPLYEGFGKRLVRHLRSTYQCPVAAENDGNCALLAEKWLGHAQNCASFATIVLGTSVGGGLMINHQLVRGKHLLAGEFGYMLFPTEMKDWELWSIAGSTRTLVEETAERIGDPTINGQRIDTLVQEQDPRCLPMVADFVDKLAAACYSLQYMIDPEIILIGGGISASRFLIPQVNARLAVIAEQIPSTVIVPNICACRFGNESNLLGACYNWLRKYKPDS